MTVQTNYPSLTRQERRDRERVTIATSVAIVLSAATACRFLLAFTPLHTGSMTALMAIVSIGGLWAYVIATTVRRQDSLPSEFGLVVRTLATVNVVGHVMWAYIEYVSAGGNPIF